VRLSVRVWLPFLLNSNVVAAVTASVPSKLTSAPPRFSVEPVSVRVPVLVFSKSPTTVDVARVPSRNAPSFENVPAMIMDPTLNASVVVP
jgi:hypothetical protein